MNPKQLIIEVISTIIGYALALTMIGPVIASNSLVMLILGNLAISLWCFLLIFAATRAATTVSQPQPVSV